MTSSGNSENFFSYAGDVTANDAWEALKKNPEATLVDVRTQMEWDEVGEPDLSTLGRPVIKCSWRIQPGMAPNPEFPAELSEKLASRTQPVYFICKGGGRSREAAITMTSLGFVECYNVLGGFEGKADRPELNGWKAANLPWNIKSCQGRQA